MYGIYITLLFLILVISSASHSFEMDQTYFQMATQGLESKHTLTLKNDRNEKRFLTIEVVERTWNDKKNVEERVPTKDFKVSEKAITLLPSAEAKLTLDWIGSANLKAEKAYRLIVTEVRNQQKEGKIEMKSPLIQYIASVFVAPENAKDDVKLVQSKLSGKSNIEVTLTNSGSKHKLMSESGILIQDAKNKSVQQKFLKLEAFQQVILMPGQTKTIVIPTEVDWKNKKMTVSIINE
ncbi:MAG: hypothetical protein ACK5P5_12990 [Pseudobdellovibrionaceae bacterium]